MKATIAGESIQVQISNWLFLTSPKEQQQIRRKTKLIFD